MEGLMGSLTLFAAPLCSREGGDGADHDLFFLVTSPHPEAIQEPTQSLLIRPKDTPSSQEIPRDLGAQC